MISVKAPLSVSLRALDGGHHAALVCLAWAALGRARPLWDAAAVGRRSIRVRWCAGSGGMGIVCPRLLQDNLEFLRELAALDGCTVAFRETPAIPDPRDLVTSGMVSAAPPYDLVHDWAIPLLAVKHQDQDVLLQVDGTHRTTFVHRGFRITLVAAERRVWWSFDVPDQEEPRPWAMDDTKGFLLQLTVLVGTYEMAIVAFPTPHARHADLRACSYLTTRYDPPPGSPDDWYVHRHALGESAVYVDDGIAEGGPVQARILIEEKPNPTLCATPASLTYGTVLPLCLHVAF